MSRLCLSVAFVILFGVAFAPRGAQAADAPAVSMFSLLEGFDYYPDTAWLKLGILEFSNLPADVYSEYGDHKLWAILRTSTGAELFKIFFGTSYTEDYYQRGSVYSVETLADGLETDVSYMLLDKPGNYALDFYADGMRFYTFPFSATKAPSASGEQFYYLGGDWERLAFISYDNADPEDNLKFNIWLRDTDTKKPEPDLKAKIFNKNGGALVCVASFSTVYLKPRWTLSSTYFFTPPKSDGSEDYFYAKDILSKDGNYVMKVYLGGELFGEYDFSVSGGRFSRSGRMARGGDTLSFVEGGIEQFWYERK